MIRGLLRTVLIFVPVFLVATFVTFALRALSGLSPAHLQLGESATPEMVARIEHEWGLDRPFLAQYFDWFGSLLRGDLGVSWFNGADIARLLLSGAVVSLSVAGLALVIAVVAQFCDEVLVMRDGEVVEQGPVEKILYQPEHEYTRLLIEEHESYGLERYLATS